MFVARHKQIAHLVQEGLERSPLLRDAVMAVIRGDPEQRYARWVTEYDTLDEADQAAMTAMLHEFRSCPTLSVLMRVGGAGPTSIDAVVQSLVGQIYGQWHAEFVDVGNAASSARDALARASDLDRRFTPLGSSAATAVEQWNAALRTGAGEFAVVVDATYVLRPHALLLLARALASDPSVALVYGDEDVIDANGTRRGHYFKPDWNAELLRGQNYFGGFVCFRRSLAESVDGCTAELDDDHLWGLLMRMTASTTPETIRHLPFVLSHRTAASLNDRSGHRKRAARAQERRLLSLGERAHVAAVGDSSYRVDYRLLDSPVVSLVIPTTGATPFLRRCLESVLEKTSYPTFEVLVVLSPGRTAAPDQRRSIAALADQRVRFLTDETQPFNFSRVNNFAAQQAKGELLCFLNDDTEVIERNWLSSLVAHALRRRVGAAGAMLLYQNGRIQHAGVVLGVGGIAAHAYRGDRETTRGYHDRALVAQDVSCVTAASMVVRRAAFDEIGGFDEELAMAYNDVDLCLRLRCAGWRIVWTPSARLYHKESASFGPHDKGETEAQWTSEWQIVKSRWARELQSDRYYNPNLSLDPVYAWEPAFPPRVELPWRSARR